MNKLKLREALSMGMDILGFGDIDTTLLQQDAQFEDSITDYVNIVKKCLFSKYKHIATLIIKNEDAMAHLATTVMLADWRWNGKGTRTGYRTQCVTWAINKYIARQKHEIAIKPISLNTIINNDSDNGELADLTCFTNETPALIAERTEECAKLHKVMATTLTTKQELYIRMYYFGNMSYENISQQIGVSKQAVSDGVLKGIKRLREVYVN